MEGVASVGMLYSDLNSDRRKNDSHKSVINNRPQVKTREHKSSKKYLCFLLCLLYSTFFFVTNVNSQTTPESHCPIERIEIIGLYSIHTDELLYLLNLSEGEILNKAKLRTGIKRAFLKRIFDDIIIKSLDDDYTVLKVIVKERGIIGSIKIEGNDHFSTRFIRRHLVGINERERISTLAIGRAIYSLERELRKRGFVNADVDYSIIIRDDNRVDIVIEVKEGHPEIIKTINISGPEDIVRRYLRLSAGDIFDRMEVERMTQKIIEHYQRRGNIQTLIEYSYTDGVLNIHIDKGRRLEITFRGNAALRTNILMAEAPFFDADEFNHALVKEAILRIIRLYHHHGYLFAYAVPSVSISKGHICLEFSIFEGVRQVVNSITFVDTTIPHEKLKGILTLRVGGHYSPRLLKSDTEVITRLYRALGHLHVEVCSEVKMADGKVEIRFFIEEGPQILLSKISITGNRAISDEEILREILLEYGIPYNEMDIFDARRRILRLYSRHGFLNAAVTVGREIHNASANITFNIEEGDMAFFGKTIVRGNEQTRLKVIKRELLHETGAPLDYGLVIQQRGRLHDLGLFSAVEVKLLDKGADNKRDVLVELKEAPAGVVEFGLGYGDHERFRGFLDISHRNLWGMNREAAFRAELDTLGQRFIASYYEPWFLKREVAFRASLLHERRTERCIDTDEIRYRLRRSSASAGIEKRLSENLKAGFYYDFSVVRTFDVRPGIILGRGDEGTHVISRIRPALIYDTRDDPFNPRRGVFAKTSLGVASGIFLSEVEFVKLTAEIARFQSLGERIVLVTSLRGGAAQGFGDTKELPLSERFFLGGGTTVRGFEQDALGPETGGDAFVMGNIEFRVDVWRGFGLVAFLDGGNVWRRAEYMDITDLRYTAGVGLKFSTPIGPFRIDHGHKLDRKAGESRGVVHFSIGHAF